MAANSVAYATWAFARTDRESERCVLSVRKAIGLGDTMKLYFDFNDWWVGYYRSGSYHYVCPFPTLVIRWPRRFRANDDGGRFWHSDGCFCSYGRR